MFAAKVAAAAAVASVLRFCSSSSFNLFYLAEPNGPSKQQQRKPSLIPHFHKGTEKQLDCRGKKVVKREMHIAMRPSE